MLDPKIIMHGRGTGSESQISKKYFQNLVYIKICIIIDGVRILQQHLPCIRERILQFIWIIHSISNVTCKHPSTVLTSSIPGTDKEATYLTI